MPFEAWNHSPVAAEVDAFLDLAAGGLGWLEAEVTIYQLVGGLDSDSDEDNNKDDRVSHQDMEMTDVGTVGDSLSRDQAVEDPMEREIPEAVQAMDLS